MLCKALKRWKLEIAQELGLPKDFMNNNPNPATNICYSPLDLLGGLMTRRLVEMGEKNKLMD